MRSVIGPALLLLMTAALLYTSFHTNQRVLGTVIAYPRADRKTAPAAVLAVARDIQARAAGFHADLGRWPDTPADLDLDARSTSAQGNIRSLRFGAAGEIAVELKETADAIPVTVTWKPRTTGARTDEWVCSTNAQPALAAALACVRSAAIGFDAGAAPVARPDSEVAVPGVNDECRRLGRITYAAAQARAAGDSLDTFTHRPLIAFVDDPAQRDESKIWAQRVFEAPPRSPRATQRAMMREHQCFAATG